MTPSISLTLTAAKCQLTRTERMLFPKLMANSKNLYYHYFNVRDQQHQSQIQTLVQMMLQIYIKLEKKRDKMMKIHL